MLDFSLDDLNIESTEISEVNKNDIAIIGLGGRLPECTSLEDFHRKLCYGKDFIRKLPNSRREDTDHFLHFKYGQDYVDRGYYESAYLDEIDKFDYPFFKIPPAEAELMDPVQKIFLEVAWETFEDAGYGEQIEGTRTGIYIGYGAENSYEKYISEIDPSLLQMGFIGNTQPIIASRIAQYLNLKGPSFLVDSTCSSSLVAVHLAVQGIRSGDCEMALVGGISLNLLPAKGAAESGIGILSSEGRAMTFDDRANGTSSGEGAVTVLLKPLHRAIRDQDNVYAIIKGSAINHDGKSLGITAPNPDAQCDVIMNAWADSGIDPTTISYIEAHGTGTKLGDPIEVDGINRAFRKVTDRRQFCAIGSVKTNIGHLGTAAGLVALVKSVLALKYKELPPSIHFEVPNKKINFIESAVYVNERLQYWEPVKGVRRCGISAFGLSGTNCHVVLEEVELSRPTESQSDEHKNILTMSAKTNVALKNLIKKYQTWYRSEVNLNDLCYTANIGRWHYNHRLAIVFSTGRELIEKLYLLSKSKHLEDIDIEGVFYGIIEDKDKISPIRELLQKEADSCVEQYVRGNRELAEEICQYYVSGLKVHWQAMHKNRLSRKISIPHYPFEKHRSWLDAPIKTQLEKINHLISVRWIEQKIPDVKQVQKIYSESVLLVGHSERSKELENVLELMGKDVFLVDFSNQFCQKSERQFQISGNKTDYAKLFNELNDYNITEILFVHDDYDIDLWTAEVNKNTARLLNLIRSIDRQRQMHLTVLSRYVHIVDGCEASICPQNAAIFGLAKVIPLEYPNLTCRLIDYDDTTKMIRLYPELEFQATGIVAYRNNQRYVQQLDEISGVDSTIKRKQVFRKDGVYVITGGTGGIGQEVAKFIASQENVKLILISRTKILPRSEWNLAKIHSDPKLSRLIHSIRFIEEQGTEVHLYQADVTDEQQLSALLSEIETAFGEINGVFHSAGVSGTGMIHRKKNYEMEDVLLPKIKGTINIHKLTLHIPLDFFVMFSSATTLTGIVGQSDYCAANAFLDSFEAFRHKLGLNATTIKWTGWSEIGMLHDYDASVDKDMFLSNMEAMESFDRILNLDLKGVIVAKDKYIQEVISSIEMLPFDASSTLLQKYDSVRDVIDNVVHSKENSGNADFQSRDKTDGEFVERTLQEIWCELFGKKDYSIDDDFFDLGGHSLLALRLESRLEQKGIYREGADLQRDIYSYSSIRALVQYLTN